MALKSVSASIIALSGAIILTGGSFIAHNQTQAFLQFVGAAVGLTGLIAWYVTFTKKDSE